MVRSSTETEVKFVLADTASLPALRAALADLGADVRPSAQRTVRDRYLDTEDWWLYRAGVACRVRVGDDGARLTLKALSPPTGNIARRTEIEEMLPAEAALASGVIPDGKVAGWLRPLMKHAPVKVILELEKRGETFHAAGPQGLGLKVTAETVRVVGAGEGAQFAEAELELVAGRDRDLRALAKALQRKLSLEPGRVSKFERGLDLLGVQPPRLVEGEDLRLQPSDRFVDAAYRTLRRHFGQMLWHEPGTRLGINPESLHDMRVATRRLRAALGVFRGAFPARREASLGRDLRWLAQALGRVRDLDVHLTRLEEDRAGMSPDLAEALDGYRQQLDDATEKARTRMLRVLDSQRYATFVKRFGAFLDAGPPKRPGNAAARIPVTAAAPRLVKKRLRQVLREGRAIRDDSPNEMLHQLRIRCKRLRYAAEFFADLYGAPAARFVRAVVRLQDILGLHQDACVAQSMLERFALELPMKRAANRRLGLALGMVAARHGERARKARNSFAKAWKRFARKKARAPLTKRMKKLRPDA